MSLWDLKTGQTGIVYLIDEKCKNKKRLTELGFNKNSEIVPLHKSLSGNLIAYWVKGAVIAIRKEDAQCIKIALKEEV